jgi:hypothetical protein
MTDTLKPIEADTAAAGDPPAVRVSRAIMLAVAAIAIATVMVSASIRMYGSDFYRGIRDDELITVQNYTWAGVKSDGTRRRLERFSDIRQLGTPTASQFIIGLYASLGRWPEPNNHVVHSLLLNGTLPLFKCKEIGLRLPALLAAMGFSLAVAVVCWRCGWHATAALAATMAFWNPYVVLYSQEARGYTCMLFLVTAFLIGCHAVMKNPSSILIGSALVLLSVCIFENTVNMAFDWVAPCYLLMVIFPGLFDSSPVATSQKAIRRKALVVHVLCIGLAGFIFLVDRLPYVYSSSQQYGFPFHTWREFFDLLANHLGYLFSSPSLIIFAMVGAIGMGLAWRERPARGFVALSGFAVLVTILHFGACKRFAYERNVGFWILPVLLGCACLGERLIRLPRAKWQRVAVGAAVHVGALAFLLPGLCMSVTDTRYEAARARIRELPDHGNVRALALLGFGVAPAIYLDFPRNWSDELTVPLKPGSAVDLVLIEKQTQIPLWGRHTRSSDDKAMPDWPNAERVVSDGLYSIIRLPCRVEARHDQTPTRATLLWYPSFEQVAVSPDKVLAFLNDSALSCHEVYSRYQAKLEVFGRLECVVAAGANAEETRRISTTFAEAVRRFGGQVVLLLPRDEREQLSLRSSEIVERR